MSRRPKSILRRWITKEPTTRKSLTEMGFAEPNKAGIRPTLNERGRPSLYQPDTMPYQAYIMCAQHGATFAELAAIWGITASTVSDWVNEYPDFAKAIRAGRDAFNVGQIEQSLVKRALGFEYEEVSTKSIQYKIKSLQDGKEISKLVPAVEVTRTKKLVAPDVAAIIFYLKNRDPERWKDKMAELSISGDIGDVKATLTGCSVEELRGLRDAVRTAIPGTPKKEITQ